MKKHFPLSIVLFLITLLLFTSITRAAAPLKKVKVVKKNINILDKPDLESTVLMQVDQGTLLEVKKRTGEWYHVVLPVNKSVSERTGAGYGFVRQGMVEELKEENKAQMKKKDTLFLMGMGMLRLNWASVKGDAIRFRYSDMGLPSDFSTRERASFMVDGTFGRGKYTVNGFLNYDP